MKINCKYCRSENVVKRGLRRLKKNNKQRYLCKDCMHSFSVSFSKKRINIKAILNAVCAYNQGYSYEEICNLISRKNKVMVSKSSVARWVDEFDLGYLKIKNRMIKKYSIPLIIGRLFKHSGLIYNFKYHKGKLNEFCKFSSLIDFINNISKGVDDNLFRKDSRCSNSKSDVSVNVEIFESKLNKKIGDVLKLIENNKQRHSIIEELMLNCDRDTVAVEVPVWFWDKNKNIGICGHIDILQVKFEKIWILDYKPEASNENYDSVISQLYNYALGLSFRTKISLKEIKCGWFDEDKIFSFDADKVRVKEEFGR